MRSWSAMTERKPSGMSWETWIEAQIRVAREEGAFDNLPGAGKPLHNLGQGTRPALVGEAAPPARADFYSTAVTGATPQGGEGTRRDREAPRRGSRPPSGRRTQHRDRQDQCDRDGGAADAPQHAGRR